MKKPFVIFLVVLLSSCTHLLYVSIEQLTPPAYTLPVGIRSVAVLNNFSRGNALHIEDELRELSFNSDTLCEYVAQEFAATELFQRVMILDSLLSPAPLSSPHLLSVQEVNSLCLQLGVDLLYVVDYAYVTYSEEMDEYGMYDVTSNLGLMAHYYTPSWVLPRAQVMPCNELVPFSISDFSDEDASFTGLTHELGMMAASSVLPVWKSRERVFYSGNRYEYREAEFALNEGDWDGAAYQWQQLCQHKKQNVRRMAAFNMAVYYEVTDSIDSALEQLDKARALSLKKDKKGKVTVVADTTLIGEYRQVVKFRQEEISRLDRYFEGTE